MGKQIEFEVGESVLVPRRVACGGMVPTVQRATNRKFIRMALGGVRDEA